MKIIYFLGFWLLLPLLSLAQGFTISGTELHDANGKNFIIKGINVPLAWFVSNVNSNIANIRKNTNANTLRIVVQTSTADNDWQTCVKNCIANNMIPMVELHDVTGSTSTADLQKMATFWASKASFLTQPQIAKYILINIANEWSDWTTANTLSTAWRDTYISCIKTMRNAGIKTTIVVDAPGYGQDGKGHNVLNYGPAIESGDPLKNVLFSIHMYCEWSATGSQKIAADLPNIKKAGLPIILGEFGWQESQSGGNPCNIDESLILSTCQSNGIGWIAWSWKGNNTQEAFLDLSTNWEGTSLTTWGNTIVNGANGTKTAATASVFSTITENEDAAWMQSFQVSPNPASDELIIQLPDNAYGTSHLTMSDCYGKTILSEIPFGQSIRLDVSTLQSGVYFIQWTDGNRKLSKSLLKK